MKNIALLTLVGLAACAQGAMAQIIVASSTAPVDLGTSNISQFTEPEQSDGNDFSDSGAARGESFTVGDATLGYDLNSITIQSTSGGNDYQGDTYAVAVYLVEGYNELSYLGGGDYTFADTSGATSYTNEYLTFDLTAPIVLAPSGTSSAVYAYTITRLGSSGGYLGFGESGAGNTPYTGGSAFYANSFGAGANPASVSSGTYVTYLSYDQNFDVGLTAIGAAPEPSTWALVGLGAAGLLFLARRRLNT